MKFSVGAFLALGYKDKKEVLSAISEDEIHSELQYTKLMDALMKETTIK